MISVKFEHSIDCEYRTQIMPKNKKKHFCWTFALCHEPTYTGKIKKTTGFFRIDRSH